MDKTTTYRVVGVISVGLLTCIAVSLIATLYQEGGLLLGVLAAALGIVGILTLTADWEMETEAVKS